ncbi:MAG: pseudouridine-5'-phosphate glycosidase [Candidatus Puniceispirillaceae bacterium]
MKRKLAVQFSEEVAQALAENRPVVALESTIISHGLPYPDNIATAKMLEDSVRKKGAIPATIAVIGGMPKAGLTEDELGIIAAPDSDIMKLSRRDLPFALSKKTHGATTVATTMIIAEAANISVFATGGIGGVHRGADTNFDISADLPELGRTNVAVVCAGPKAILDIPATLEYLETLGVPVIGYQCDDMPAFWSRSSGTALECRLDTPAEIADLCRHKWQAGLSGGVLIANPVPAADEISQIAIETAIETALKKAASKQISGKNLTPFLLEHIRHITDGASLESNKSLVANNATLAADIAIALAKQPLI